MSKMETNSTSPADGCPGNAGLRVYDIKDPLLPVENGWFIPPQPSERAGPLPRDLVTQTEDVLVDTRGYIYVTESSGAFGSCAIPAHINRPRRTDN